MQFRRIWYLRGPNYWSRSPVVEAELVLGAWAGQGVPAEVRSRLHAALPHLPGAPASPVELFLAVVRALQEWAEEPRIVQHIHPTREPGFYRVIVSLGEAEVAQACLEEALRLVLAAWRGESMDAAELRQRLRDLALDRRLGPSTAAIVRAAEKRGIPTRRLNDGSLVQLGWGKRQHRIWTAETDQTSALAEQIAQDKNLTRLLLGNVGVPVPWGRPVQDADDAVAAAEELGYPVVVKPQYGNQGRGVLTHLRSPEQVRQAYAVAAAISSHLMVEQHIEGADHRLLVVGGRLVAASLREPAQVIGDGIATIRQLVDRVNQDPRRSDGHGTALSLIKIDSVALGVLEEQGFTPDSVPAAGQKVLIRRNANLSTGGTATDVTDAVHPSTAAKAVDAAKAVGLDVAGVDVVTVDISRPLEETRGAVVEVNAGPGLRMHLEPSAGQPRPVGEAIVDSLFPPGETGRIPLVAVTGTNGKTTTTRLLNHLFRQAGHFVGMTCTDGLYLDGRRISTRDCSGPQSARQVFMHPAVTLAVLETARGGILREGLGFDFCDCAVVTNIGQGDHLGLRGIETLDELCRVKRVVVEAVAPQGHAVLNAADPRVCAMAAACPGRIVFFAADPHHPELERHRHQGGRIVTLVEGMVTFVEGEVRQEVVAIREVPITCGGRIAFQVENVLSAAGAAWVMGLSVEQMAQGLRTFVPSPAALPGRFNVLESRGGVVIVDYAHNPSAVDALADAVKQFPHPHRTLVFSGCDRRDADIIAMGLTAGNVFDRIILYKDWGRQDRKDGELNALLREGIRQGARAAEVLETDSERQAIDLALQDLGPGKLVVVGVEAIEDSLNYVAGQCRSPSETDPA